MRVYAGGMYNAVRELSAALASHVGMTRQSINAIERGRYDPNHVWPLAKYHSYLYWTDAPIGTIPRSVKMPS